MRSLLRAFLGLIVAALGLATAISGCAAESTFDRLPPEMGGMPANAPARPTTPYQYPAVHDMPPPRSTQPLTEEEQFRLEKELQAARARQESLTGTGKPAAPPKTAAPATREKASTVVVAPPIGVRAAVPARPVPPKKASTVAVVPPAGARASAPAAQNKASTIAVIPPPGVRASAPPPKKKPTTVIVVPPAGVTANP